MQYVWVILLFLPSALSQSGEKFRVGGPDAPVFSVSGSDVILPCSVRELERPKIMKNAVGMNITWSRSDLGNSLVHLYGNHKDLNTGQIPFYRGRTAVFKEQLKNGNVSLKLSSVRISDEGEYTCRVESRFYEDDFSVKLSVEVMGSEPVITMEKYESGKFSLLCESKGWYPKPELQWRNSKGVNLTAETETQTVADLFNVKSRITVEEIDLYFCTVSQRNHEKEERIDAQTLHEHVPNPGRTAGITFAVLFLVGIMGVIFYIYNERRKRRKATKEEKRKREEEINEVKSLLNSDRDRRLQHHDLSPCQRDYVERTLLKSEEEREEFNLKKFDPSDIGVEKLKKVIASSKKALLEDCDLTWKSCEYLASVLKSENSLIELNLSKNKLRDSGVENLCEGLKDKNCKLEILRLEFCNLTEKSCADLAKVLKSVNSPIELNLSKNKLQDSGVNNFCYALKDENCKLQKLRLEDCDLTEKSCEYLASVLKLGTSKLIELNLSENKGLKDSGVNKLCKGLKDGNCKLEILRLEDCGLREYSCITLADVLKSGKSKLIELNLSKNELQDSGVKNFCDRLKDKNWNLNILRLEDCGLTEESCIHLADVLKSGKSKLIELNLSHNKLRDSRVGKLCDGLKNEQCKLQILRLEDCVLTKKSCADLASVLKSENSKLIELNLNQNWLQDSGVEKLCDGLKDEHCKLQKLRLEDCDLKEDGCKDLAKVLKSENSKLIELNLSLHEKLVFVEVSEDSGVENLCDGLKDKNCKLQKLRLYGYGVTDEGFTALASALIENPSSPLKELDLSRNGLEESKLKLLPKLKDTLPKLKVIF